MAIQSLGYLGIASSLTQQWSDYSTQLLGMQLLDSGGGSLSFRMDDHKQRLFVDKASDESLVCMGWELEHPNDLQHYAAKLDAANVKVTLANSALADKRFVSELIFFDDPAGNRIELFYGPMLDSQPFIPGRAHSGFKTGPFGMGHVVLHAKAIELLVPFYRDLLAFSVSDYALSPIPLYFFHVNSRHHSFALIGSGRSGFHHFMVEYCSLDDVGQGYDIACLDEKNIAYTLGRHTNDWMTSFYSNSPSQFFVESGWGGRLIDTKHWQAHETNTGPSYWGHDRLGLSPELREAYRDMRLALAAEGKQSPALVDCPWLYDQLNAS